jgi:hypothetical protein
MVNIGNIKRGDFTLSYCELCSREVFGENKESGISLCKEHYIKIMQLVCWYGDRENCTFDGTDEEWGVVDKIATAR